MQYKVKTNESIDSIARQFGITSYSIIISNSQLENNTTQIKEGQIINVPVSPGRIVSTSVPCTYEYMVEHINTLKENYPFLRTESIGKSVLGKDIYALSFGKGKNEVTYNSAHHANEWITTPMLMRFVEEFVKHIANGESLYGFDPKYIYETSTIRIIPMVNPDGVNLQIKGLTEENKSFHDELIKWNNGSNNFASWAANIRGVDLNHNYDAEWHLYKGKELEYGIAGPGPSRYAGLYPHSEPETLAMVNFTNSYNFKLVIAYHTQGEIIYWDFMNKAPKKSLSIAQRFAEMSGYTPIGLATGPASTGGYKDWFIENFKKPGFTIEAGLGKNPLPIKQFDEIYNKNIRILLLAPLVKVV